MCNVAGVGGEPVPTSALGCCVVVSVATAEVGESSKFPFFAHPQPSSTMLLSFNVPACSINAHELTPLLCACGKRVARAPEVVNSPARMLGRSSQKTAGDVFLSKNSSLLLATTRTYRPVGWSARSKMHISATARNTCYYI